MHAFFLHEVHTTTERKKERKKEGKKACASAEEKSFHFQEEGSCICLT
jgi:hypothetical protein